MKTILIHSTAGGDDRLFDPDERDGCNDPAIYLRERLSDLGYQLKAADNESFKSAAWIFFYDAASAFPYKGLRSRIKKMARPLLGKPVFRDLYSECIGGVAAGKQALFLWEASAVSPDNWDVRHHRRFPVVFTWNDSIVDNVRYFKIFVPQPRKFPAIRQIPFADRKLLVNISANKFSSHPRELYSARRETIGHFEETRPDDFDLYGVGWNKPARPVEGIFPFLIRNYPSYKGTVSHKWDVLPCYRFSVCYENIRDEVGYITEKIFDSMRAGCVPVYWGAPNIADHVDKAAFIDRRHFKTNEELARYLSGMGEPEYQQYQNAIQRYLASERFEKFLPPHFADTIIRVLNLQPNP